MFTVLSVYFLWKVNFYCYLLYVFMTPSEIFRICTRFKIPLKGFLLFLNLLYEYFVVENFWSFLRVFNKLQNNLVKWKS